MTTEKDDREAFEPVAWWKEFEAGGHTEASVSWSREAPEGGDGWQPLYTAPPEQHAPARYFASGPQGHAWFDDLGLACSMLAAFDKDDDWTITDTQLRQHILRLPPCATEIESPRRRQ